MLNLMASILLCGGRVLPKDDITNESTKRNSNHDPTVVRHKDKPVLVSTANVMTNFGQLT
jgi:hypothetical protein